MLYFSSLHHHLLINLFYVATQKQSRGWLTKTVLAWWMWATANIRVLVLMTCILEKLLCSRGSWYWDEQELWPVARGWSSQSSSYFGAIAVLISSLHWRKWEVKMSDNIGCWHCSQTLVSPSLLHSAFWLELESSMIDVCLSKVDQYKAVKSIQAAMGREGKGKCLCALFFLVMEYTERWFSDTPCSYVEGLPGRETDATVFGSILWFTLRVWWMLSYGTMMASLLSISFSSLGWSWQTELVALVFCVHFSPQMEWQHSTLP